MPVEFFTEDVSFQLTDENQVRNWIKKIIRIHQWNLENLNYIFCSDNYLLDINIQYLDHDTYTDIITFDNSDIENTIEGDIFISVERIVENAAIHEVSVNNEIHRVMAHGLLHLLGQGDKSPEEKKIMTGKEDECLHMLDQIIKQGKRST